MAPVPGRVAIFSPFQEALSMTCSPMRARNVLPPSIVFIYGLWMALIFRGPRLRLKEAALSRIRKTLQAVLSGSADANVSFGALSSLLAHLGFAERITGSHHVFSKQGIDEIINLQPRGAKAKPYQVKQTREIIRKYGLEGTDDSAV